MPSEPRAKYGHRHCEALAGAPQAQSRPQRRRHVSFKHKETHYTTGNAMDLDFANVRVHHPTVVCT